MRRPFALGPKILRGFYQAGAKKLLPQPIDLYSGGERMVFGDQPTRQIEAIGCLTARQRRQHGGNTAGHRITTFVILAALENVSDAICLQFLHDHRRGQGVFQIIALLFLIGSLFQQRFKGIPGWSINVGDVIFAQQVFLFGRAFGAGNFYRRGDITRQAAWLLRLCLLFPRQF